MPKQLSLLPRELLHQPEDIKGTEDRESDPKQPSSALTCKLHVSPTWASGEPCRVIFFFYFCKVLQYCCLSAANYWPRDAAPNIKEISWRESQLAVSSLSQFHALNHGTEVHFLQDDLSWDKFIPKVSGKLSWETLHALQHPWLKMRETHAAAIRLCCPALASNVCVAVSTFLDFICNCIDCFYRALRSYS